MTPRMRLLAACQFGGSRTELEGLLQRYDYVEDDLKAAIAALEGSATAPTEVHCAEQNAKFLERKLAGLRLLRR